MNGPKPDDFHIRLFFCKSISAVNTGFREGLLLINSVLQVSSIFCVNPSPVNIREKTKDRGKILINLINLFLPYLVSNPG